MDKYYMVQDSFFKKYCDGGIIIITLKLNLKKYFQPA